MELKLTDSALAHLDISREEIIEATARLMVVYLDEMEISSDVERRMKEIIREGIDAKIERLGAEHVMPHIDDMIANAVLQQTNTWGETIGGPKTVIEYLVDRANAYMTAEVNSDGESREECQAKGRSFNRARSKRLAYMIDKHLHYAVETAIESALKDFNEAVAGELAEVAKMKLKELSEAVKVAVKVGR